MLHRRAAAFMRPAARKRPIQSHYTPNARFQSSQASRLDRVTARLPRSLQKYTIGLRNAPVSHIVSFLILHELTAVVPLFALFGVFHYTNYIPIEYMTEHFGAYVDSGLARFEKYFARKGWFGFDTSALATASDSEDAAAADGAMDRWRSGDQKYRILVEVALAYAVTKALLPVRIVWSVWATPWFAGGLTKAAGIFARKTK
jgi:hypothetical protein